MSNRAEVIVNFDGLKKISKKDAAIIIEAMADVGEVWMTKADELIRRTGHVFTHRMRNDLEWATRRGKNEIALLARITTGQSFTRTGARAQSGRRLNRLLIGLSGNLVSPASRKTSIISFSISGGISQYAAW